MYRINRYSSNGRLFWRVWRGAQLIARGARGYANTRSGSWRMELDLIALFPQWLKLR